MRHCHRKVGSESRVAGVIVSLVNDRGLQFECTRILHETLLVPVFMYGRAIDMEGERVV